jgi:hypothetical protein
LLFLQASKSQQNRVWQVSWSKQVSQFILRSVVRKKQVICFVDKTKVRPRKLLHKSTNGSFYGLKFQNKILKPFPAKDFRNYFA